MKYVTVILAIRIPVASISVTYLRIIENLPAGSSMSEWFIYKQYLPLCDVAQREIQSL